MAAVTQCVVCFDEIDNPANYLCDNCAMELEQDAIIRKAAKAGIELSPGDFEVINGESTLDGMDPAEWLEAMTQA